MVKRERVGDTTCLCLLPNRSATWRQTRLAIGIVAITTLTIASVWAFLGFWLILPFAGLEVALFAWSGYRVCASTYHQQVVLVSADAVEVQWGSRFPKRCWHFNRADTRLEVIRPHHSLSPHRLILKDSTQKLLIADQLNHSDVKETIDEFRSIGFPLAFGGKTVTVAAKGF